MPNMQKRFHWISVTENNNLFLAFGNLHMKHVLRLVVPSDTKKKQFLENNNKIIIIVIIIVMTLMCVDRAKNIQHNQ